MCEFFYKFYKKILLYYPCKDKLATSLLLVFKQPVLKVLLFILLFSSTSFSQCLLIGTSDEYKQVHAGDSVTITWSYSTSVTALYKFRLRRATLSLGKYAIVAEISKDLRSYTFSAPSGKGDYHYFLEACGDSNCSVASPGSNHVIVAVK